MLKYFFSNLGKKRLTIIKIIGYVLGMILVWSGVAADTPVYYPIIGVLMVSLGLYIEFAQKKKSK
ncbi:hypothetical protein ACFL5Y_00465 [Candidatus Omnitrophota bacterium]